MRTFVPGGAYVAMVAAFALTAQLCLPRSNYRTFIFYILAFSLFNGLRVFADSTGNPVAFVYPIEIDGVFGANPSLWLQERLYTAGRPGALGWAAIGIYSTYFVGHYLFAVLLWRVRPQELQFFVATIVMTLFLGLIVYYLVPTAPPWLAAEIGELPGVVPIAKVEQSQIWADAYSRGSHVAGANDVAAMPSLHTAITVVIALMAWRVNRGLGLLGFAYVAGMGFSLVFLGEHYVIDVLAGAATAAIAWRMVPALQAAWNRWSLNASAPVGHPSPAFVVREDSREVA